MIIFPAIDLLGGKCVRLFQGAFDRATHFDADPLDAARRWRDQGATWLHIVDLDGARQGSPVHLPLVAQIARATGLPLRLGGGLRTLEDLAAARDAGVRRVAIGTAALDGAWLRQAVEHFGAQTGDPALVIEVALDRRGSEIAVEGWQRAAGSAGDWARRAVAAGVRAFLVTDITRDGTLSGANLDLVAATRADVGDVPVAVTVAGGVTTVADLRALARAGADGAVIGRALYDGRINLAAALSAAQEG